MVNINTLLDSKNQMLFSRLQAKVKIDVAYHTNTWYAIYSQNNEHIIYVPMLMAPDPAAFAHELLHIDFNLKGMEIPAGIRFSIFGRPSISMCFNDILVEHISNCFNHIKMLPDFLQLGYQRSEFISDFHDNKLTHQDVTDISLNYRSTTGVYNSESVGLYIGKYVAAKTCPNTSFDYSNNLKALESIDSGLFWVLEQFYDEWNAYDNTTAPMFITPNSIVFNFVENLEKWSAGKSIQ